MSALCRGQLYHKRMKQAFDKKVHPREFREEDLVLKKIPPFQESFLRRCNDPHNYGWRRTARTSEHGCSAKILCLKIKEQLGNSKT